MKTQLQKPKRNFLRTLSVLAILFSASSVIKAGTFTRIPVIQGDVVNPPLFTQIATDIVRTKWDDRCTKIPFVIDTSTLPNEGFPGDEMSAAEYLRIMEEAVSVWNEVPTSYIEAEIVDTRDNVDNRPAFDFVNRILVNEEIGGIAGLGERVALTVDAEFTVGQDIDEDGDSDVFDPALSENPFCHDFDGDGDIEFPAGFYERGTIMEANVSFSSLIKWTADLTELGVDSDSGNITFDLLGIAIHEFGHTFGLDHSPINIISESDGTDVTMYYSSSANPELFAGMRTLSEDDKAWISYAYPEGSAATGPAAVQPNDIAFDSYYGLIQGTVEKQDGTPVMGTHVTARSVWNEDVLVGGIGGTPALLTTIFSLDPSPFSRFTFPDVLNYTLEQTRYVIPVPRHAAPYQLKIEGLDGSPTPQFSLDRTLESIFTDIPESYYSGAFFERLQAEPRFFARTDFAAFTFPDDDDANFIVPQFSRLTPGETSRFYVDQDNEWFIRRFSGADVLQLIEDNGFLNGVRAMTAAPWVVEENNPSEDAVPRYGQVVLATGKKNGDGQYELVDQFIIQDELLADDRDFTFIEVNPILHFQLAFMLEVDPELDVFLALEPLDITLPRGRIGKGAIGVMINFGEEPQSFVAKSLSDPLEGIDEDFGMSLEFIFAP